MNKLKGIESDKPPGGKSESRYFQSDVSVHDGPDTGASGDTNSGGYKMRKVALLLAVAMAVSTSTAAFAAAKKKAAAPKPAPVAVDPNANGAKFVSNAFAQIFVPWQSMAQPKK